MSDDKHQQQRETLERPGQKVETGLEALKRAAKEVAEKDRNGQYTMSLASLDVLNPSPKDKDVLTFMQSELLNIFTKIAKKYPDKSLKEIAPKDLSDIARKSEIELRTSETIALSKLDELNLHPNNPTTQQLNAVWASMIRKAEEARNGITQRYLRRLREKPGETIIYTLAGAAGIYLGIKLISWLAGKAVDKAKKEIKETAGKVFSTGNILAALGLGSLGAYWGKDWLKKKLYEALGITGGAGKAMEGAEKAKAAVDKLNKLLEKLSKATTPEEIAKLQKEILEQKQTIDQLKAAGKTVKEKTEQVRDEGILWSAIEMERKIKITPEEKQRAKHSSEYLKSLGIGLDIKPEIMFLVNEQKYDDFIQNGPGALDSYIHIADVASRDALAGVREFIQSRGSVHLLDFFTKMLKNQGKFEEFKGKTVYQVIELIEKNQDKYIDKEAFNKEKEGHTEFKKLLELLGKIGKNPSLLKDDETMNELLGRLVHGGWTLVTDATKATGIWILKNGTCVAITENKHIVGAMHWIAKRFWERESYLSKATGAYLYVGAYTMAIGAISGGITGGIRAYTSSGSLWYGFGGAIKGQWKGLAKGFAFPGKVGLKGLKMLWDWKWHHIKPTDSAKVFFDQQRYMAEEFALSRAGKKLGMRTLSEKIFSGEIEFDEGDMRRLETYRHKLKKSIDRLLKKPEAARNQQQLNEWNEEYARMEKIQKLMTKLSENKLTQVFDEEKWGKAIDEKFPKMDESYKKILKDNKRLGILTFNEKHPLGQAMVDNPHLIEYLDKNKGILDILTEEKDLIKDPKIQEALKTRDMKKLDDAIKERSKAWESMSEKEKAKFGAEEKPAGEAAGKKLPEEPVKTSEGKYRYMGEEFTFTEEQIKAEAAKFGGDTEKAIKSLCEQQWNEPRQIGEEVKGRRTYRYRSGEFTLTEAEYSGKSVEQIKEVCEAKFAETIRISEVRIKPNGVKEYKIGKEWVELPEDPKSIEEIRSQVIEELKKSRKPFDVKIIDQSKLLKYFPIFQKTLGAGVAAMIIYHLETAQDKRKAVADTALGFGAFMAGMKTTELTVGRFVKHPVGKFVIDVMGGVAATLGLQGTIKEIIEKYWPKFPGMQQMSSEAISIFEKLTARSLTRTTIASIQKGVIRKGIEKVGLKTVSEALNQQIKSTVLKKLHRFAAKISLKQFTKAAAAAGGRAAVGAAMLANDATVIGVLDDPIAIGLLIWAAVDAIQMGMLLYKAHGIYKNMNRRSQFGIAEIKPASEIDQKAIEAALAERNKTSFEGMNNNEIMDVINSIADIHLKITRNGIGGYEEYHFRKGEVFSTKMQIENGEVYELSDEELNQNIDNPPPKEFKTIEIDYKAPKEKLLAQLRMALLITKAQCGWVRMDFDILDENSITLKRLDGGETVTLKRSGESWSVKDYKSGLNLFQAIAMGNLLAKIKNIINKEGYKGSSSYPFEIDGNDIDFKIKGKVFDLTVMSAKKDWLGFYDKIGLKQKDIVEMLNQWYSTS